MAQYQKIGMPVETRLTLFRNSALYEERAGLARLVVGGAAHGQVLISQQADLVLAALDGLAGTMPVSEAIIATERHLHYSAAEVGVGDRIYRTWMLAGADPEVHAMMTLTALADGDPGRVESCRTA